MILNCLNLSYINKKIASLHDEKPKDPDFLTQDFSRFCKSLTLKELLIYNNKELYQRFQGYINQTNLIKKKTISQIVKEFIGKELFGQ